MRRTKKTVTKGSSNRTSAQVPIASTMNDPCAFVAQATEHAILQAYVTLHRQLTDRKLASTLQRMLHRVRSGELFFPPADDNDLFDSADIGDFLDWSIGEQWRKLARQGYRLTRRELAGLLASILGSIDCWTSENEDSQGYLRYLETLQGKRQPNEPLMLSWPTWHSKKPMAPPGYSSRFWSVVAECSSGTTVKDKRPN